MIIRMLPATDRAAALESLVRFLLHFLPGKQITVTADEFKIERSVQQRKALFAAAYKALMPQIGLRGDREKDDLHRFFCCEYWGHKTSALGERIPIRTTTTDADGKRDVISMREQLDFYAFIQQRAAEFGYDVPDPDPLWRQRAELDAQIDRRAA